jgi:hypothetical protein
MRWVCVLAPSSAASALVIRAFGPSRSLSPEPSELKPPSGTAVGIFGREGACDSIRMKAPALTNEAAKNGFHHQVGTR